MDCIGFDKYVIAVADGVPEIRQNREALEHLSRCSRCARRVADITSLKAALARVYSDAKAPEHLKKRIVSLLETERRSAGYDPEPRRAGVATGLRSKFMAPVAIAAALLVAVLLYRYWPHNESYRGTITVVTGRAVADAREQHRWCVANRGPNHHDASLKRDLNEIARRLSRDLQLTVFAPDLSQHGFVLVGADRCGMLGRRGAHVLYRSKSAEASLSVFTVGLMAALGSGDGGAPVKRERNRDYFVSAGEADKSPSVVAWHDGRQTYVVCGDLAASALLDVVDQVRVAETFHLGPGWRKSPALALVTGKKIP